MSGSRGNSGSAFSLSPRAARRMGHDVDEIDGCCPVIGFRLVLPTDGERVHMGSTASACWGSERTQYRTSSRPDHNSPVISFRLAREGT